MTGQLVRWMARTRLRFRTRRARIGRRLARWARAAANVAWQPIWLRIAGLGMFPAAWAFPAGDVWGALTVPNQGLLIAGLVLLAMEWSLDA